MMKRYFIKNIITALWVIGLLAIAFNASADPVDAATAKKVALTQLKQITSGTVTTRSSEEMELVYQAGKLIKNPYFYVFNSNDKFVIVSGDDKAMPVLGYSDHGAFDPNNIPPNMADFLKCYEKEIEYVRTADDVTTRSGNLKQMWESMIKGETEQTSGNTQGKTQSLLEKGTNSLRSYTDGDYLIKTQWDQRGKYIDDGSCSNNILTCPYMPLYEYYCPVVKSDVKIELFLRTAVGCTAVSMGQIIRYWGNDRKALPDHGYGSHSYTPEKHPEFGVLSADFENTKYDYSKMPVSLGEITPEESIKMVALLLYHCGVSVNMDYGTLSDGGSGAHISVAASALKNNFALPNAKYIAKKNLSKEEWESIIKKEILSERPVIYAGYYIDDSGQHGHAFVCDGYKSADNKFHMNWGWGGAHDGFFLLTSLNPQDGNFSDLDNEAVINIEPANTASVAVTSVSVSPAEKSIAVGETVTLSATVAPDNVSDKSVTWSSNDKNIATVTEGGVVKGIAAGTAIITATSKYDNSKKGTCKITVVKHVTGVSISPATLQIAVGDSPAQLTAVFTPADVTNKKVTWTSNDNNIATVSADGKVTAVKGGSTKIVVTTEDGSHSAMCEVTVKQPVTGVTLSQSSLTMKVGDKPVTLTKTIMPADATNQEVTWSSNNACVTVSNGIVTPVSKGTAIITVTTQDGNKTATCTVTVTQPVTGVSLNKTSMSMIVGGTETLTPIITPNDANNKKVTWSSSNHSAAIVDENGKITALAVGTTTITVTTQDGGKTATCSVNVTNDVIAVEGITVTPTKLTLKVGGATGAIVANIAPATATNQNVIWSSSNNSVAAVSNGIVTPLARGTATITAKSEDGGFTATCAVTVEQLVTGITLSETTTTIVKGSKKTLTANVLPENANNKKLTWTTNNSEVATVSDGVVTATGKGSATITATAADGSGIAATCIVTVTENTTTPVINVSLDQTSISIHVGNYVTLTPTINPINASNRNVSWSSNNTAVATVDENGKVVGIAPGIANITVTTEDGNKTATCVVNVSEVLSEEVKVTGISLNQFAMTLEEGSWKILTANISPSKASNQNVTWMSSNPSVATVTSSGKGSGYQLGKVEALSPGNTVIIVKTDDGGFSATCVLTVNAVGIAVSGITLRADSKVLSVGNKLQMNVIFFPSDATNKNITWVSSDESIATIDKNGVVTAVGAGHVIITARSQNGHSATYNLKITPATGIEDVQSLAVWSYGNKLYVNTPVATDIHIYNLLGTLVYQTKIPEGQYATEMYRGTYIVIVGNNLPIKVFIK